MSPISLILFALAACCNAVMDVTSHRWYRSIFSNYLGSQRYTDPAISWANKYDKDGNRKKWLWFNIHPAFTDLWHLMKSSMIVLIAGAIVTYEPWVWYWDMLAYGLAWNLPFSLMYHKILTRKS